MKMKKLWKLIVSFTITETIIGKMKITLGVLKVVVEVQVVVQDE